MHDGCLERRIKCVFDVAPHVRRGEIAKHFAGFEFYDGVEMCGFVDFYRDIF